MSTGNLRVRAVETAADRRAFVDCRDIIHKSLPLSVVPLRTSELELIDPAKSAFLRENKTAAFIAERGGVLVGRIMAVDNAAYQALYGAGTGHFGFIEAIDDADVFKALTDRAADWLRARGLHNMMGPMSPSINHETGLLIEGFDHPPTYLMNYAPPYYATHLEALGFGKAQDVYSFLTSTSDDVISPKLATMLDKIGSNGQLQLRTIDTKRFAQELELLIDIYNDGWSGNWGAVPMSRAEAQEMATQLKPLMVPDWVVFVEHKGEPIAAALHMPDLNQAIADLNGRLFPFGWAKLLYRMKKPTVSNSRILLLGVRRAWHNHSLGPLAALMIIRNAQKKAQAAGITTSEVGWILESNKPMLAIVDRMPTLGRKIYRIYERAI